MVKDNLHVFKDPERLLIALADFIVSEAENAIAKRGKFNFVLSGGNSPKKLYQLLASKDFRDKIAWKKVFFFFGDERSVPADHPDSNYHMAREALFLPLGIPEEQIAAINTGLPPVEAARNYEKKIIAHFGSEECSFDLILLGLGDNAHTASLFPHTAVLHEHTALVKEVYVSEVQMYRITFTAGLINAAYNIVFLVYGASKAEAVKHILKSPANIDQYPGQLIQPEGGSLQWFLDKDAASGIE